MSSSTGGRGPGIVTPTVSAAELGPIPSHGSARNKSVTKVGNFDLDVMKKRWRSRIEAIAASGVIPIVDIESSYNPKKLNPKRYAKTMDKYGVGYGGVFTTGRQEEVLQEGQAVER